MKLFIGCSSYNDIDSKYYKNVENLLEELFKRDNDLCFGACDDGIMGVAYKTALKYKRDIIGIYPNIYENYADKLESKKIPVKTVGERTEKLINESDALIFLPGGYGTLYELFTSIESKRGCEHNKPIIIYNSLGYFDKLLDFIDKMCSDGFAKEDVRNSYYVSDNTMDIVNYLNNYNNIDG